MFFISFGGSIALFLVIGLVDGWPLEKIGKVMLLLLVGWLVAIVGYVLLRLWPFLV